MMTKKTEIKKMWVDRVEGRLILRLAWANGRNQQIMFGDLTANGVEATFLQAAALINAESKGGKI